MEKNQILGDNAIQLIANCIFFGCLGVIAYGLISSL